MRRDSYEKDYNSYIRHHNLFIYDDRLHGKILARFTE